MDIAHNKGRHGDIIPADNGRDTNERRGNSRSRGETIYAERE
jgi:hypothetical protein